MKYKGKVHKFGNNVNTDEIIPGRYLYTKDPRELGMHCMEDIDKDFHKNVKSGDIIVAGTNFGCGSSREHAPIAIKSCGISCVIAVSFARIFYRNAINIGLPIIVSGDAVKDARKGDSLSVDMKKGIIKNITRRKEYTIEPTPVFIQNIIKKGGLLKNVR